MSRQILSVIDVNTFIVGFLPDLPDDWLAWWCFTFADDHLHALQQYARFSFLCVQILLQNKFLDQQQVGEMAMIPPSDARERLYQLLKDRCGGNTLRSVFSPALLWSAVGSSLAVTPISSLPLAEISSILPPEFLVVVSWLLASSVM